MTADATSLLVGFDSSRDAIAAIEYGALLFPDAQATIAHIWMPPFTTHPSAELLRRAGTIDGLTELLQQQGAHGQRKSPGRASPSQPPPAGMRSRPACSASEARGSSSLTWPSRPARTR